MVENCETLDQEFPFSETLQTMIDDVRETTGRFDVSDPKMIVHINNAQRFLDRRVERRQQRTSTTVKLPAGTVGAIFTSRCRSIERAYVNIGCERLMLYHKTWQEFRGHLQVLPRTPSDWPRYYTEAILHRHPGEVAFADLEGAVGYMDTIVGASAKCNGIVIHPSVNRDCVVEVIGNFYDDILSMTWPYSWWVINHPDLLKRATQRELEVDLRNTEGQKDFENAISEDLRQVDHDEAMQESNQVPSRMEG